MPVTTHVRHHGSSPLVATLVVAAFSLVSAETYLATHARAVFKMAFMGVGPTALRIVLAAGAHKQEDVLSSRVEWRGRADAHKVFLRLKRTRFVIVVYDTEDDVDYLRLADDRALSRSVSMKIVEVDSPGTARESIERTPTSMSARFQAATMWQ